MNEQERSEQERLKQRQTRLAQEPAQLSTQLNLLEQRLGLPQPAPPAPPAPVAVSPAQRQVQVGAPKSKFQLSVVTKGTRSP